MEIASVPSNPAIAAANAANNTSSAAAISSDFETFLKMLTVQMQNQNPLDPVKSEDFAVQLATFSGVEQQVQTNDLLKSLATQMNVMGMSQLSGWVGMEARAPVAAGFDGTNPVQIVPNPPSTAESAILVVRNASGEEVQRALIPVSGDPLEWNGVDGNGNPFPVGLYDFSVEGYNNGDLTSTRTVDVYTEIVEARVEGGETILLMSGGATIAASLVSGLRQPLLAS